MLLGRAGYDGSRAAFAKVTRSKWLLDLWAMGSGVCGRAASRGCAPSSVVLRSVGLRASYSLCQQSSTPPYYVMMVVKRSWIRTQNTFTPFPLLLAAAAVLKQSGYRTENSGGRRQYRADGGGAPKVYCHCETALQTAAAFLVDLSSKCNCRKCFAIFLMIAYLYVVVVPFQNCLHSIYMYIPSFLAI